MQFFRTVNHKRKHTIEEADATSSGSKNSTTGGWDALINHTDHQVARGPAFNPRRRDRRHNVPGHSDNYTGDRTLDGNKPANIPEGQPTSFYISRLSPDLTLSQLLDSIRDVGRVYHVRNTALLIQVENRDCILCSVLSFLAMARKPSSYRSVSWIEASSRPRKLVALADESIVKILELITNNIKYYTLLGSAERDLGQGRKELKLTFASYRAQAEAAYFILRRQYGRTITLSFDQDSCGHL
ncbi:hypothetical protein OQA88_9454 [Cercophora sp. LCS_1]